jgi:integrase
MACKLWGDLSPDGLTPDVIQTVLDQMADTPAKANVFLATMKTASGWARKRKFISQSWTEGIDRYKLDTGHKPWTPEQVRAIDKLDGMVRRGLKLYLYTGQRGSDVVRLGFTDIDEGGLAIRQLKTGRQIWCPIVPELAREMATWEKRPGPFLQQANGKPYDRRLFWLHFKQASAGMPEFAKVTLHGLRCTAVINLRRQGLELGQIQDIVGLSLPMITRYCRFADMKESGKAALVNLMERRKR